MSNIQIIDDNKCFKWSIVRYLNPADRNLERIAKAEKYFAKKRGFEDVKFPFTKFIHSEAFAKSEKKSDFGISYFICKNKETPNLCIKKFL